MILVNAGRHIVWRAAGPLTDAALQDLVDALNAMM